jgi:branched-subunit amino acid aminotransferase/4-amino-4-deoxychorismate lyase
MRRTLVARRRSVVVIPAFLNGQPASAEDLRALALNNYGHYTSMQMRARAVRGLDLHLQRLHSANRELFDADLDETRVRAAIVAALDAQGIDDASIRVTVFSRDYDYMDPGRASGGDILVTLTPPRSARTQPLRLKSYPFERAMAHIKHVGTFPQLRLRGQALRDGYDDALFIDAAGHISEGSIWNIVFWDGRGMVWPVAPALLGTTERLLQAGLDTLGVPQQQRAVGLADAIGFRAAFATNSAGIQPVEGIDGDVYAADPAAASLLASALDLQPWQAL